MRFRSGSRLSPGFAKPHPGERIRRPTLGIVRSEFLCVSVAVRVFPQGSQSLTLGYIATPFQGYNQSPGFANPEEWPHCTSLTWAWEIVNVPI